MDGLRWILLAIGIVILFAIWWFGRQKTAGRDSFRDDSVSDALDEYESLQLQEDADNFEQQFEVEGMKREMDTEIYQSLQQLDALRREEAGVRPAVVQVGAVTQVRPAPRAPEPTRLAEEKIVVLHVAARKPSMFTGSALLRVFKGVELEHGEMRVFERIIDKDGRKQVLFRVANMVKPGVFDPEGMQELTTSGVSLFMQLPGPIDGLLAFEAMLDCARELATRLGGNVLDESHSVLSAQTINHLREGIQEFSVRVRMENV